MSDIKITINKQYNSLRAWFLKIPSCFNSLGREVYSKRNVVRKVTGPGGELLTVKRYKEPNVIQKISYTFFRRSKAARAYLYGEFLCSHDIPTPHPVAYIEEYNGKFLKYCYFVSLYSEGESCMATNGDLAHGELAQSIAAFMARLHSHGFMHGDPNLSNFIYIQRGSSYEIATLDLNRSYLIDNPSRKDCLNNFMRLTHEIATMELIVSEYAKIRKWDVHYCVEYVEAKIRYLEMWEDIRCALKRKVPEYRRRRQHPAHPQP